MSINGNELVAITATCQTFVKDVNHLRDSEKGPIQQAKSQLEMHANSNFQQLLGANHKFCDCRYSFEGNQQSCNNCNSGTSNYQNDQYSVSKAGDNSFAISKPSLIANMARLFVDDDLFTVVYRDGTVKMRPIACLSSEEKQIIEDGRLLVQKAEEKFNQEMEEFGRNLDQQLKRQQQDLKEMNIKLQEDMEKMNKRLQQDLEKMENDLKNKFSKLTTLNRSKLNSC